MVNTGEQTSIFLSTVKEGSHCGRRGWTNEPVFKDLLDIFHCMSLWLGKEVQSATWWQGTWHNRSGDGEVGKWHCLWRIRRSNKGTQGEPQKDPGWLLPAESDSWCLKGCCVQCNPWPSRTGQGGLGVCLGGRIH